MNIQIAKGQIGYDLCRREQKFILNIQKDISYPIRKIRTDLIKLRWTLDADKVLLEIEIPGGKRHPFH